MFRNLFAGLLLSVTAAALADGPAATADANAPIDPDASRVCPQDTGSRIKQQPGNCQSSPGRTYGSEELRSTGEANTAQALRRMDPSLTIGH